MYTHQNSTLQCWKSHVAAHLVLFSVPSSAHLLALVDENGSLVIYNTNRYGEDALLKGTVLPAKRDSDVMFCSIVIRNLESIDHLCINPIRSFLISDIAGEKTPTTTTEI